MTVALEIHDAGILVVDEAGTVSDASPGYALYDGGTLITGEAAWRRAREKPRWIHHRFWQDLGTEPLGRPFPRDLSPADLAHAHLSEIWGGRESTGVLLAVPGSFSSQQLGRLLGIARACGMPVEGLVDSGVAAVVGAAGVPGARLLHLDLQLHRLLLTELDVAVPPSGFEASGHTVVRRRLELSDGVGEIALQDAWARKISELFVHATRFDPLHSAATEQALYSSLPAWLDQLSSQEILPIALGPAGAERSIELTRPDIIAAADELYEHFLNLILSLKPAGDRLTVLLSQPTARLPGLEARIAGLRDVTTVRLPAGAAARGALRAREQIRVEQDPDAALAPLPLITRLSFEPPAAPVPVEKPEEAPAPQGPLPTHLLHDGLAYPITDRPFLLGVSIDGGHGLELSGQTAGISRVHCHLCRRDGRVVVADRSTYGSFLNGERIGSRAALQVGDRLRLGTPGIEVRLIAVVDDDEVSSDGAP